MKIQYRNKRIEMLTETTEDERFAKELTRFVRAVSNDFMAWYGDVSFDGKETSGFVITTKPTPSIEESIKG